jgi:spermidine synthase
MDGESKASRVAADREFPVLLVAFFLSGCSSLGFEMVWLRLLGLALGHESVAMLGALAGFFGGLGAGAWLLDGRIRRSNSPGRIFVRLELVVALFGILSPFWLFWVSTILPSLLGKVVMSNDSPLGLIVSIVVAGVGMLPGTLCMGATLPALVEARRRTTASESQGANVGWLYGANTFGASVGLLLAVYIILPFFGFGWGAAVLSLLNIGSALLVWRFVQERDRTSEADAIHGDGVSGKSYVLTILFFTGLAGLGIEVVGIQIVSQILYGTVYSFAAVTFAYLVGTAVGGVIYGALLCRMSLPFWDLTRYLLLGACASVVVSAALLRLSPALLRLVERIGISIPFRMAGELMVGAFAFLLPVAILGMLYPHLMSAFTCRSFGRAYGLNMVGAVFAPILFGAAAIPILGYTSSFYAGAALLFLLAIGTVAYCQHKGMALLRACAILMFLIALAPRSLHLVPSESEWKTLYQKEGLFGVVEVSELKRSSSTDGFVARRLRLNTHHYMGGGASFGERRMGFVPYLLRPEARRVLMLGVGTGATLSSLSGPSIEHVDAVEIVPGVLETLPYFNEVNDSIATNPRVTLHNSDARRFGAASSDEYDLIVADLFHPGRDGAGSLYTKEHFEAVRDHLKEGAIFAQWLPLYQLDERNLKTIIRTFLQVFPEAHSLLGLYNTQYTPLVLIGARPGERVQLDVDAFEAACEVTPEVNTYFTSIHDYLAAYMLDAASLSTYAGNGPVNADLNPRILFDAPRTAYSLSFEGQRDLLLGLLSARSVVPPGFVVRDDGDEFNVNTANYSRAVELYLESALSWRGGVTAEELHDIVDAYLEACRVAPEFTAPRTALLSLMGLETEVDDRIRKGLLRLKEEGQSR